MYFYLNYIKESEALIDAVKDGDTEKVSELLQRGADPNFTDLFVSFEFK